MEITHRAKKSLGQNFLKNEGVLDKIIDAAELTTSDMVLEIGPGLGALTEKLLVSCRKVIAIEKDRDLFEVLGAKFSDSSHFFLQNKDILEYRPEEIGENYKLVANIPYNITGAIIEKFLSTHFQPEMMVLMVQKEVAERIVAKDKKTGGPGKESILSIAVKAYGTPIYIATVRAGSFVPAPSIDSAVIKIANISRKNFIDKHHEEVFFQVVKAGFAHKRKALAGNLKNILEPEIVAASLDQASITPNTRAEDLRISDWLLLANIVYNKTYAIA